MTSGSPPVPGWFDAVVSPRSIAIVGASDNADKSRYLSALLSGGYEGRIYPINPRRSTTLGVRAYPSLAELPGPADLVIVSVPVASVLDSLTGLASVRPGAVYVGTAGFAELGPDGGALQRQIADQVTGAGARLIGPNGNGVFYLPNAVTAGGFAPLAYGWDEFPSDRIALLTQSGAVGASIVAAAHRQGLGISTYVSTGNEADVTLAEFLDAVTTQGTVDVVAIYLEGLADGQAFLRAVRRARSEGVTVVVLKVGRTAAGAEGAASHTASLAGDDVVYGGLLRQAGAVRVHSTTELLDVVKIARASSGSIGGRIGAISFSGGMAVMLADELVSLDFELPRWSQPVSDVLQQGLPEFAGRANPIDGTGSLTAEVDRFATILSSVHGDSGTDATVLALGILHRKERELADVVADVAASGTKPLAVAWIGGTGKAEESLAARGVPAFRDIPELARGLAAVRDRVHSRPTLPDETRTDSALRDAIATAVSEAVRAGRCALDEADSKQLLRLAGLSVPRATVVTAAGDVEGQLSELNFPLVAKILAPGLIHKTDAGGVVLGIVSVAAAEEAVAVLLDRFPVEGVAVILEEQVAPGTELLFGMSRDVTFGPTVTVGIGGIYAEAFRDTVVISPDQVDEVEVDAALRQLTHQELVAGFRGLPAVRAATITPVVQQFARLVHALPKAVAAVDVNPVVIQPDGPPVAVDATFVLTAEPSPVHREV